MDTAGAHPGCALAGCVSMRSAAFMPDKPLFTDWPLSRDRARTVSNAAARFEVEIPGPVLAVPPSMASTAASAVSMAWRARSKIRDSDC